MIGAKLGASVSSKTTMISFIFLVFSTPVFGGVILPSESVVRGGLAVSEPYKSYYNRKLDMDPYYGKFGTKYFGDKGYPSTYQIAAAEHDIKHQLAELERNIAAARPYLATNPLILREAEEQLKTLQHIHAGRLLQGIESIRQLELQQEVLIHKVNSQLENSVKQLKQLAVLQQEISNKQKSVPVRSGVLPQSTIEASKELTAQLHAIEAAKEQAAVAHEIAKDVMDHAIAKDVVEHAVAKDVMDHAIAKEVALQAHNDGFPRRSGVSSDEGLVRGSTIDPRSTSLSTPSDDSQGLPVPNEEDKPLVFELGRK